MKYRGKLYVEGSVESRGGKAKTKGYSEVGATHKDIAISLSLSTQYGVDSAIRYASDIYKWKTRDK